MRISLFYNQGAGEGESLNHIRKTLERQGHTVVQVVEDETDLGQLLATPSDLVVAAGGDGTVSAVARLLAGRGTPLAILPTGTANNIARSVGTHSSLEDASRRWRTQDPQPFDVGVVAGDWGESRFVEGVGAGFIPAGIRAMDISRLMKKTRPNRNSSRQSQRIARLYCSYGRGPRHSPSMGS